MYQKNLGQIQKCLEQNRQNGIDVTLIAVSKTRSASEVLAMHQLGVRHFGENYVQEAIRKQIEIGELVDGLGQSQIIWHLIGPLQSNKAKLVAPNFDWFHTLTNDKQARLLDRNRPLDLKPMNICIQVNIDQAPTKNGLDADLEVIIGFIQDMQRYSRLSVRGLMVMPDASADDRTLELFQMSRALFDNVKGRLSTLVPEIAEKFDTLSMGMSTDYLFAIEAGSTMVRIGTALFGPRGN